MKEKKTGKNYLLVGAALAVVLAAAGLVGVLLRGQLFGEDNPNLALKRGVKATCDSVEQEALSAAMAIDGNDIDRASRWSSENNREDASHYIQLEFPEEISVSFVVLKWERANAVSYALEGSADGTVYETLAAFESAPETLVQEIVLEEPVRTRFLRLSTYAVSKESTDYSDLYQNVSLYEFEVYGDKPTAYKLKAPVIEKTAEGGRRLAMPETPDGFRVTLIGADLEQVIGADGTVYDTIQNKEVTVGYRVEDTKNQEETREVSFVVEVPAATGVSGMPAGSEASETDGSVMDNGAVQNLCPEMVFPAIAEWRGGRGVFQLEEDSRIIIGTGGQPLRDIAALMAERCEKDVNFRTSLTVCEGTEEDAGPGDIFLGYAEETNGLGREGYVCDITDKCVIKAEQAAGVRWGTVTLMQLLFSGSGRTAPQGQIRDYPLYEVRGFGIDVARKAVSLDLLYAMMETMSWYKMNDLTIHLNDNEILATSGLTDSAEHAMTAESAFRLESDVLSVRAGGENPVPQEYVYTKEELAQFIATAKAYGVTVVPEIDTPAHSLSITKRYPAYALRTSNESVDQIDLGNEKATALVEELWRETLDEEIGAFREAEVVGIGMDEYYGDGEQYRQYLVRINNLAQETGKTVRLWGSLSNMGGTTVPSPENLQMNIWSTVWADPMEMYGEGYSLINMQNNHLYIIPGGGYDRLDGRELYENWAPNRFYDYNRRETVPAYSPQMLGASYMIWNDMCGRLDVGISEYDLYERFMEPLGVLSGRLWGMDRLEPSLKKLAETLASFGWSDKQTAYDALQSHLSLVEMSRKGTFDKQNYAVMDTDTLAAYGRQTMAVPGYSVEMKVYLEPDGGKEQVLAEGDSPYGKWAFYASEPETGKVGFTREGRTYTFDYTLPKGEWVNLKIGGGAGEAVLYVDLKEVDRLGSSEPFEEHATFVFPLQRLGKETGHFDGMMEFEEAAGVWIGRE